MKTIQDPKKIKEVGEYFNRVTQANKDFTQYWLDNTLWHWDFWVSLSFTIIPWIIWFYIRKKDSQGRLLLAGLSILTFSSWLDFLGVVYGLWHYTGMVIPTIPTYIPWDLCLLPVATMLLLQFKPEMKPWKKSLLFAALISFVGEPFFEWLGFYSMKHWSVFYSFPIYLVLYLICDWISKIKSFQPLSSKD